jgi:hypothetical protein
MIIGAVIDVTLNVPGKVLFLLNSVPALVKNDNVLVDPSP